MLQTLTPGVINRQPVVQIQTTRAFSADHRAHGGSGLQPCRWVLQSRGASSGAEAPIPRGAEAQSPGTLPAGLKPHWRCSGTLSLSPAGTRGCSRARGMQGLGASASPGLGALAPCWRQLCDSGLQPCLRPAGTPGLSHAVQQETQGGSQTFIELQSGAPACNP